LCTFVYQVFKAMLLHHPLLFLESLGTGEVLLIVFVIIVFFGGKRIPEMARVLGKGMREFKAAAGNIQDEIQKSVTEIERHANVDAALKNFENTLKEDSAAPTPQLVPDQSQPQQIIPPATSQLLRADKPEEKKDTPPASPSHNP
jgi:TatA/E family protein of Tat protein translocase